MPLSHILVLRSALQRITRKALGRWTNKVIDLKLREIEIVQRREASMVL
jgi:hypothetical protein